MMFFGEPAIGRPEKAGGGAACGFLNCLHDLPDGPFGQQLSSRQGTL